MIDSNIIDKIHKLRAITEERGATEDEAIAAEQRMFSLLAKYNLEISQIPDDEPTRPDTRIESESAERPSSVWKQYLYTGVASLNFSECFTWRHHMVIVGTRANRIATLEMASYLIRTVERLANKEAAEVPGDERRRFRHSYAEGCATRIYERLEQMRLGAGAGRMKAEDPNSLLPRWRTCTKQTRHRSTTSSLIISGRSTAGRITRAEATTAAISQGITPGRRWVSIVKSVASKSG